jgi:hypothetical protein
MSRVKRPSARPSTIRPSRVRRAATRGSQQPQPAIAPQPLARGAWLAFERALAAALADIDEDEYLVIVTKRGNRFVQFAGEGAFGMRAESVSNAYLEEKWKLSRAAMARMQTLGWKRPTHDPRAEDTKHPIDGSPNFYIDASAPVPFASLAKLAVRTLREIHRVAHPGRLEYHAFTRDDGSIRIPSLKLRRVKAATRPRVTSEDSPAEPVAEHDSPHANLEDPITQIAGQTLLWKAVQQADEPFARVCDADDRSIARVEGDGFGEAISRARLMASAAALQQAARGALAALRAIHANEEGTAGLVAGQAIPGLELALQASAGVPDTSSAVM